MVNGSANLNDLTGHPTFKKKNPAEVYLDSWDLAWADQLTQKARKYQIAVGNVEGNRWEEAACRILIPCNKLSPANWTAAHFSAILESWKWCIFWPGSHPLFRLDKQVIAKWDKALISYYFNVTFTNILLAWHLSPTLQCSLKRSLFYMQ